MPTPDDYTPDDYTPSQWKAAWTRGMIGQNTGMPLFPPSTQFNSRGEPYNPARVGAGGVNTGARFPRGDEQPPAVTPAAYKPGDPPPPAPANENINDPTPPTSAAPAARAEPAAPAAPVTPGQYSPTPWGHPQVAGIPRMPGHGGVIGNPTPLVPPQGTLTPPPDKQGNRYWNPVGQQQPFADQINRYAHEYGIPPALLSNLLRAESNFDPNATGPMTKYGQAGGIAQFIPQTAARYHINPYDPDQGIRGAAEYIRDLYNQKGSWGGAVAAYNGAKSLDVSQYRGSPEGRALIAYTTALDGGAVQAGPLVPPPQNYRPASYTPQGGYPSMLPDRPPSQWGRDTPDMFEGPGAIPHQREIPGILKGLAPLLLVGLSLFSKGAALPMLSFYGGYLKASAAKQDKDAKELKTKYQDQLKELKAKMSIEQTAYAGAGGDTTELRKLATEFGDSQLLGLLDNGKDPGPLFQQRDRAFQDVSKTAAAELAARREDLAERREERTADYQNAMLELAEKRGTEGEAAAKQRADKAKAALDKAKADHDQAAKEGYPNPGAVGPGTDSDEKSDEKSDSDGTTGGDGDGTGGDGGGGGTGEQGAATPPASAAPASETAEAAPPAATPVSAPAAPQQAATPDTGGRDQIVDAQGNPIRPRSDIQPAVYRGGTPTAQPAADTTGGDQGVPGVPRTPYEGHVSEALNGTEYNQLGVDKRLIPQISDGVTAKRAEIDSLPASDDYLDKLRAIDKPFGDFIDQLSNYNAPLPSTRGINGRAYFNEAMAAARKANPNWSYQNFKRQEEFADQKGPVQARLTRAATMGEATGNIARDLKVLQEKGYGPNRIRDALQKYESEYFDGKEDFTDLVSNLKTFTQEDQVLKTGTATVTETEAQQAIVAPPLFIGTPEQIRGYVKANIGVARAAIDAYQERWTTDADGKTRMPGRNTHADSIIGAMPYWNSQNGTFDNVPPDVKLPAILSNSIPNTHDAATPTWAAPHEEPRMYNGKKIWPKSDGSGWAYGDGTEAK